MLTLFQLNTNSELLSNFLDEIETKYKIDFTNFSNFDLASGSFDNEFDKNYGVPQFLQMESSEGMNPLKIVENLGTDEMFDGKKANPDDELPDPNSKEGGAPCINSGDCTGFQLKIMK